MGKVRCPSCNKQNPEDAVICQFCQAPLGVPPETTQGSGSRVRAGEEPVKKQTTEFDKKKRGSGQLIRTGETPFQKDTGDLEDNLPPWLQTLREGSEDSEEQPPFEGQASPERSAPSTSGVAPLGGSEPLDWLNGLESAAQEEDGEFPTWMAGLRSTAPGKPEAEKATPAPAEPGADQPPAWFANPAGDKSDTQPGRRVSYEQPKGGSDSAEDIPRAGEVPDWLEQLKAQTAETAGKPAETGDENVPDWLSNLPAIPMEPAADPSVSEPDWLDSLKDKAIPVSPVESPFSIKHGAELPPAAMSQPGSPAFVGEDLPGQEPGSVVPDWLAQLQSDVNRASSEEKRREEFESAEEDLPVVSSTEQEPEWLAGLNPAGVATGGTPALVMPEGGDGQAQPGGTAFSLETPDWLSRLRPERKIEIPSPDEVDQEPVQEGLETAELPSWVQAMRPLEAVVADAAIPAPDETSPAENSGPLAGLRGVLPARAGTPPSRKPPLYAVKLQVSSNQQRYAALLEKMVQEEGQPKRRGSTQLISGKIWRLVIACVLLAAVSLPMIAGVEMTPDMVLFPSEWEATNQLLNRFGPDSTLLLVFDYDPALSGELEAAAGPVVDRLLFLGSRLAFLSTTPTGPALAEQFLKSTQEYHLQTGMQYTNLGYLPGGPAGIWLFALDPVTTVPLDIRGDPAWGSTTLQSVSRLSDFAALVILTDNADTGRIWIEQTGPAIGETPILMIISAQVEPMIRPYFDSGQIQGLVTGLVGGKAYEQTYDTPGLARRYWDSFGTGTLMAVLLISVGAGMSVFERFRERMKSRGKA